MLYRGMDKAALDEAYDNQRAVGLGALQRYVAEWDARGKALIAAGDVSLDLRYGAELRQRIDFFRARPQTGRTGNPTLAFVHGGYWQRQNKETYNFLAAGPLAHGINFANIEYTLAPDQTMDGMAAEIAQAIVWLGDNISRLGGRAGALYLAGHSAGGHLCAMTIGAGVRAGIPISGLYDLEPIRLGSLNDKIGMDENDAGRNSPILHLPRQSPPLVIAFGTKELPELRRQSEAYHAAWTGNGLPGKLLAIPNHDHFSILEELATPAGALTAAVCDLIAQTRP